MVQIKILRILALGSSLTLAACGGGGSSSSSSDGGDNGGGDGSGAPYTIGGSLIGHNDAVTLSLNGTQQEFNTSSFTFTDTLDEGESYSVEVIISPAGQTCSVANGSGAATANITNIDITCIDDGVVSDYLCRDHVTTQHNVIGNNVYEFIASDGECFGTTEDHGLTKQEIPVTLDPRSTNTSEYSVSANAKVTIEGTHNFHLVFDITNTSSQLVCPLAEDILLQNSANEEIADLGAGVTLGDIYYGITIRNPEYDNRCIPVGETRTVWIHSRQSPSRVTAEQLATLDHIAVNIEGRIPDPFLNERTPVPIRASQAIWDSEGASGQYGYTITNTFLNMTANQVYFRRDNVTVLYFDEDGYLVFNHISEISEFLDIGDDDLTDSDYLLTASGGTLSVREHYSPIVPAQGATNIVGRASKVVLHLETCDVESSQSLCDAAY